VFSHMAVMYANALYQRGEAAEGHRVLKSLFEMASHSERSRIFPGLPEYFNNEGQGRYMYLTGSASWYVLTLLTQAFGVRGLKGDLLIAPKLEPDQFDKKGLATVHVRFAGANVTVRYQNRQRLAHARARVVSVKSEGADVPFARLSHNEIVVSRTTLAQRPAWVFDVELGAS
jgi:cellobiose phosphorylase